MSKYQQKFIVQELENHEFIYPIHSAILVSRLTLNLPVNMKAMKMLSILRLKKSAVNF